MNFICKQCRSAAAVPGRYPQAVGRRRRRPRRRRRRRRRASAPPPRRRPPRSPAPTSTATSASPRTAPHHLRTPSFVHE